MFGHLLTRAYRLCWVSRYRRFSGAGNPGMVAPPVPPFGCRRVSRQLEVQLGIVGLLKSFQKGAL